MQEISGCWNHEFPKSADVPHAMPNTWIDLLRVYKHTYAYVSRLLTAKLQQRAYAFCDCPSRLANCEGLTLTHSKQKQHEQTSFDNMWYASYLAAQPHCSAGGGYADGQAKQH